MISGEDKPPITSNAMRQALRGSPSSRHNSGRTTSSDPHQNA
jgi:hypothetical protein